MKAMFHFIKKRMTPSCNTSVPRQHACKCVTLGLIMLWMALLLLLSSYSSVANEGKEEMSERSVQSRNVGLGSQFPQDLSLKLFKIKSENSRVNAVDLSRSERRIDTGGKNATRKIAQDLERQERIKARKARREARRKAKQNALNKKRKSKNRARSNKTSTENISQTEGRLRSLQSSSVVHIQADKPEKAKDIKVNEASRIKKTDLKYVGPSHHNMPWLDIPKGFSSKGYDYKTLKHFRRHISKVEYSLYMDLFEVFNSIVHTHNLMYFICGGTLLGSYRHHDMIPWDDDIDVYMAVDTSDKLIEAVQNYSQEYKMDTTTRRYKFFRNDFTTVRKGWKWPFIDINFYHENETHFWDIAPAFKAQYVYNKNVVFPLHYRPFGYLSVPSPHDAYAVMRGTYDANIGCLSSQYNHRFEVGLQTVVQVPCEVLDQYYPMVHREPGFFGMQETLKLGEWEIQRVVTLEPAYAITKPYSLELISESQ